MAEPTVEHTLVFANGALVYLGGVFIYMGHEASNDMCQWFADGTMASTAGAFWIVLGAAVVVTGVLGVYTTLRQTTRLLKVQSYALVGLALLCAASGVVGWGMYTQDWSYQPSGYDPKYMTLVGQKVCPLVLGYTCNSITLSDPTNDYYAVQRVFMPSLPTGPFSNVSFYGSDYGVNATVMAAVTLPPSAKSGRFIDLCSNVSSRVELLGPAKTLAQELDRTCAACQAVAPVPALPPWMQYTPRFASSYVSGASYLYVSDSSIRACLLDRTSSRTSEGGDYKYGKIPTTNELVSQRFFREWKAYALAILWASVILFPTTFVVRHGTLQLLRAL